MNPQTETSSDEFSGRLGLIFATIGAAIGTGNIWRFPRMVGANGGGSFLIPWLIFLFVWSIPLIIAEFALGKRSRTGTVGTFRIFAGRRFAWMGLWTAWISTAIGFYYAVVTGWCVNYFLTAIRGGLGQEVDTIEVWNNFLQSPEQVVFFEAVAVAITMAAIWRGAKAIEKANVTLMVSLFVLLFVALFLSFVMDVRDGSLDGFVYMFSIQPEYLMQPETWINGLSQSAWSCSAGMGMAITYSVYMRKDEDTTLNAATMCLANNSISIIAGLTVMMAVFAVVADPLSAVSGGSSAITFLVLPEVFAQAPGGPIVQLLMVSVFFLALSFAALTSMISTVELCVRNFVDHGFDRSQAVGFTSLAIFLFGLPSAMVWILIDESTGVAFPQFLEVQDHIWGYGLMFSGLFIAYSIWSYGWSRYKAWQEKNGVEGFDLREYIDHGVSSFRDDFINTGDNDWWIGRWWDVIMYLGFPLMFSVLMLSYFGDLLSNVHDPWNPTNPHGISIILLFWGVTATLFVSLNKYVLVNRLVPVDRANPAPWPLYILSGDYELEPRPLFRNVPEGADAPIHMLPGGDDPFVVQVGERLPDSFVDQHGESRPHSRSTIEAELA
ncbi:MAG: sodium-dependent transporter [Candidatus Thalassarchaeaceae archaeon]|jgi:NSS family neurotransmitter:Na+ symporter|nr:sodium-dependent transporter [Euryarchaeota archaeon]MDP7091821.1 sodium-dependent transporter [Candidatus Thalassarchaeaceae archaeon]MDP7256490.1 sodium-dependent transporter [Candidatus Thalassarchaeaceae archaeon]MDP7445868.1 sodium-dependent transporter [Candidatus Thalassarchaeaceae archaeon]MDP7648842.1 sodium-dependent transporter [Candidatus Thalassarchaeaceae archaeon]|tara:strand:- start:1595 stop:3418 length:1824 start_codon:yes stop_codon:yes gene_type:complete